MIEFAKVHGNGNDFIVLENMKGKYVSADLAQLAKSLCRRKFSIGADGLLVIEPPRLPTNRVSLTEITDFSMRIFNSDGSEGAMCGNGARAIARYAFEKKLARASMRFNTLAGEVRAQVDSPHVELDLGDVPLTPEKRISGDLTCQGTKFPFESLTVGVPHCVLLMKDYGALDEAAKALVGREISRDFSRFPKGSNISFAQLLPDGEIRAVTYEIGVEELTASCGTGSVAAAIAFACREPSPAPSEYRNFRVNNPGGINEVRLQFTPGEAFCHAWLRGKTALVAEGFVAKDALEVIS